MAPSIEDIISRSREDIKVIEQKQAIAKFKQEQIERRKVISFEQDSLYIEKETIAKYVEGVFTRVNHESEEITPLEQSLLCLNRTFKEINEGVESYDDLKNPEAFRFIALKLAQKDDDKNSFYLACIFASNQFKAKYPNLCEEYIFDINKPISEDIEYWKETSYVDSWSPENGGVQLLKETLTDEYELRTSKDYIILSIPFSKESKIGVAVKEISESEFSDILD